MRVPHIPSWLRWTLALPLAISAYLALDYIFGEIIERTPYIEDALLRFILEFFIPFSIKIFVLLAVAAFIAPKYRFRIALLMTFLHAAACFRETISYTVPEHSGIYVVWALGHAIAALMVGATISFFIRHGENRKRLRSHIPRPS